VGLTFTWAVLIMPYIEQENLFNMFDVTAPAHPVNLTAAQHGVPTYFCPSRRDMATEPRLSGAHSLFPGALGDYAACNGTTGNDIFNPSISSVGPNGAIRLGMGLRGVRMAEITDGASNTFLIGEKHVPQGHWGEGPWDCSMYEGDNCLCSTRSAGKFYHLASDPHDLLTLFGSQHPGLCLFAFADGSVHTLSTDTDPIVLGYLANIHDGMVFTLPFE
jgi:hypothetical protein